jgi:hypothetical protein
MFDVGGTVRLDVDLEAERETPRSRCLSDLPPLVPGAAVSSHALKMLRKITSPASAVDISFWYMMALCLEESLTGTALCS